MTTIEEKRGKIAELEGKLETERKELIEIMETKCPECGNKIDSVTNIESGTMGYSYNPVDKYDEMDFCADGDINRYECPDCGEVIANTEKEADALFNKPKEEKE